MSKPLAPAIPQPPMADRKSTRFAVIAGSIPNSTLAKIETPERERQHPQVERDGGDVQKMRWQERQQPAQGQVGKASAG